MQSILAAISYYNLESMSSYNVLPKINNNMKSITALLAVSLLPIIFTGCGNTQESIASLKHENGALQRALQDKITEIDEIQHSLVDIGEKKNGDGMAVAIFVHAEDHVMNSDLILKIREMVSASVDGLKPRDITIQNVDTWLLED